MKHVSFSLLVFKILCASTLFNLIWVLDDGRETSTGMGNHGILGRSERLHHANLPLAPHHGAGGEEKYHQVMEIRKSTLVHLATTSSGCRNCNASSSDLSMSDMLSPMCPQEL